MQMNIEEAYSYDTLMMMKPGRRIEVASVIELSEASGRIAAGLFMTEG